MDAERFAAILAAYGANPARWPDGERERAVAFAALPEGAAALEEARLIDSLLAFDAAPSPPSDLLQRRILSAHKREAAASGGLSWRPLAALAACAVFGIAIGYGVAQRAPERGAVEAALDAAFEGPAWDEAGVWDEG